MYQVILFIHSWFRWLVLIAAVQLLYKIIKGLVTKSLWGAEENKSLKLFGEVLNYQIAMGLVLYVGLSPLTKIAFSNISLAIKEPTLRFWTFEHGPSMLMAMGLFQLGKFITLKKSRDDQKFIRIFITLILSLTIILMAIPWPFLKYGRDLFRLFF